MAEEGPKSSGWESLIFIVLLIGVLAVLWFMNGGPQRADLRGVFLNPPPPTGEGGAYGPQLGKLATSSTNGGEYIQVNQ